MCRTGKTLMGNSHDVFLGISDPTRRKILELLSEREMSAVSIVRCFAVSRNAIIKHLRILEDASLVRSRREGRMNLFSLRPETMLDVLEWMSFLDKYWDKTLESLKNSLEGHP